MGYQPAAPCSQTCLFRIASKALVLMTLLAVVGWILNVAMNYNLAPGFLDIRISPGPQSDSRPLSSYTVNLYNTLVGIVGILGLMLLGFSKVLRKDEKIRQIRMESLLWAIYVNYALLLAAMIFVYSDSFLEVMLYNMFTVLIFYTLRYHFILYRQNRNLRHEK